MHVFNFDALSVCDVCPAVQTCAVYSVQCTAVEQKPLPADYTGKQYSRNGMQNQSAQPQERERTRVSETGKILVGNECLF